MTADAELVKEARRMTKELPHFYGDVTFVRLCDAVDRLTVENAKLKRWFADESAHAKEAVKEIAKLREALTKIENVLMLGGEIPCVCPEADARQIASDALASHTTGEEGGER